MAIGAPENDGNGPGAGHVQEFMRYNGSTWVSIRTRYRWRSSWGSKWLPLLSLSRQMEIQ